jgi:hypothetical protein
MDEIEEGVRQHEARVNFGRNLRLRALEGGYVREMMLRNIHEMKEFPGYVDGWNEADAALVRDGRDESLPVEGEQAASGGRASRQTAGGGGEMAHTAECIQHQETVYKPWLERWPKFCGDCNGAGAFHDWGDRYTPPSDEPCECTMAGRCARCGAQGLTEDGDGPCTACGWNYDDSVPADCICPEYDY